MRRHCKIAATGRQATNTSNPPILCQAGILYLKKGVAMAALLNLWLTVNPPAAAQSLLLTPTLLAKTPATTPPVAVPVLSDHSLSTTVNHSVHGAVAGTDHANTDHANTGNINFVVTDGQQLGENLFHSFEQFSVPRGGSVRFDHSPSVAAIFSRVTGHGPSHIEGRLMTQGSTDLYLLNPNGIVFGPEAQLQLGGSFVATTAQAIAFADGARFGISTAPIHGSAHPPASSSPLPLLTLSQPIGFELGQNPAAIVNRAQRLTPEGNPLGLAVTDGKNLSLIGGDLHFENGHLTAPSGGITLRGDRITLQNSRVIADNRSNRPSPGIQIQAHTLDLNPVSLLSSLTLGEGAGGPIHIQAASSVTLNGNGYSTLQDTFVFGALKKQIRPTDRDRLTGITTGTVSTGNAGNINITTPRLSLNNGAVLWTPTFSAGQGGNIQLQVSEQLWHGASAIATSAYGLGSSGNLTIETGPFILSDSAFIDTSTFSPAPGGAIQIEATDLSLRSPLPDAVLPNAIFSASLGSSGIPGNVTIVADRLRAESGSQITSTGGARVRIIDIPSGGRSGNVSITAREHIELVGRAADGLPTQISTTNYANESAGQLDISTPQLQLQDGARLLALSERGGGGNIALDIGAIALLQGNSEIAATALSGSGNGGNISLSSPLLLLQDSGIRANAKGGLGGQVQIQAAFVGQSQSVLSASSDLGSAFSGTVELSTLKNNPQNDRSHLPTTLLDGETEIATACQRHGDSSDTERFIISGRSGFPENPNHPLGGQRLWQDRRPSQAVAPQPRRLPSRYREAVGWQLNAQGDVRLLAHTKGIAPPHLSCGQVVSSRS